LPRDYRDLDHTFERMIVETAVTPSPKDVPWINPRLKPGERRKVLTGIPGKTGVVWTLDAKTGEFLWARPTVHQTIMLGWDPETNRPIINEPVAPPAGKDDPVISCPPAYTGGKNQPSGAYSPMTDAMYMPLTNVCESVSAARLRNPGSSRDKPRPVFIQGALTYVPGDDPSTAKLGRLEAVSASTGKTLWKYEERAPIYGSVLATGGKLVFSGDMMRRFRAFDAENGKILWESILQGPVHGRPMSYSVGGRQYIAVPAGGNSFGAFLLPLVPELSTTRGSNAIFVFALE
jgi:alcohol dehydrogenase (cytochrome c)